MSLLPKLFNGNFVTNRVLIPSITSCSNLDLFYTQKRFAARKGKRIAATREKQRLARARKAELKSAPPKVWKPNLHLDKKLKSLLNKFSDEDRKGLDEIVDNVYAINHYKEQKLALKDALSLIRETHGPLIYDEPNAILEAKIELDLRTKKKTKFVEKFRGVISYPNIFQFGNKRKVLAICKTEEDEQAAKQAGAEFAGSSDVIRMIKIGDIAMNNFDDLVCHGDMVIELSAIKGILGNYFPTTQRGNVGFNMSKLVSYFVNGLEYKLHKENCEPDYGYVQSPFGSLSLSDEQLEDNFQNILEVIEKNQPPGSPGEFITRVLITAEPSPEKFPIKFWNYIEGYEDPEADDEEQIKTSAEQ